MLFGEHAEQFKAQAVHWQSVIQLPAHAVSLARSADDPHQSYRIGTCAWGVQFHPEFPAQAMRYYLNHYRNALLQQGLDPDALLAGVVETPQAAGLLPRFAALCAKRFA